MAYANQIESKYLFCERKLLWKTDDWACQKIPFLHRYLKLNTTLKDYLLRILIEKISKYLLKLLHTSIFSPVKKGFHWNACYLAFSSLPADTKHKADINGESSDYIQVVFYPSRNKALGIGVAVFLSEKTFFVLFLCSLIAFLSCHFLWPAFAAGGGTRLTLSSSGGNTGLSISVECM